MPEIKKQVKSYKVNYLCDSCGESNLVFTGRVLDSYPPQYVHRCDVCHTLKNVHRKKYPSIEYEMEE